MIRFPANGFRPESASYRLALVVNRPLPSTGDGVNAAIIAVPDATTAALATRLSRFQPRGTKPGSAPSVAAGEFGRAHIRDLKRSTSRRARAMIT